MTSLFKGLSQAKAYATCRPTYPPAVFDLVASKVADRALCVDIGCGTGQASVMLAEQFDKVIAVDPSETQIQHATPHKRVEYTLGSACFETGGTLAIWTYKHSTLPHHPDVEVKVQDLYQNVLQKYWDKRLHLVENRYRDIPLIDDLYPDLFRTGERILTGLDIEQEVTGAQFVGYIRSWSGYNMYCKEHGIEHGSDHDPVLCIENLVQDQTKILSIWPVTMLLSTKH